MSTPDFPSQPATGNDLEDRIRTDAAGLVDTARQDLEEVGTELKQEAISIADEAREQVGKVAEKAKGIAENQRQLLADQLDGVSNSLDKVAGELEEAGNGSANYVRMMADGAGKLTSTVRDNNVDEILAIAEDFGRKQPVAFMGAAALLGFVASRFMVASASRRSKNPAQYLPPAAPDSSAADTLNAANATPSYTQSAGGTDAGI